MNELFLAAKNVQDFLITRNWSFAFIGGLAVLRWGEPRFTRDIDLTLFTGFENEDGYIREILEHYDARRPDMPAFAVKYRVALVTTPDQIPIDIALGGLPFEKSMINKSSFYEFDDGIALKTCSADDLIILKAFADRDRDWADVRGIIIRQQNKLDWTYIHRQLGPLCELKQAPHIIPKLESLEKP